MMEVWRQRRPAAMPLLRHLSPNGPAWAALLPDGSCRPLLDPPGPSARLGDTPITPGRRLAPVVATNVIGIGRNYAAHAAEGGKPVPTRPMWFMKTTGAIQDPEAPIVLPAGSTQVDYEGELAVIIGRDARDVTPATAYDHVLGYTVANDVSARDWQYELGGGQFCHGKSFDTFCPLGPVLLTPVELPDPHRRRLVTRVNGEVRQDGNTGDMVFDVPTLISFLSAGRTLPAGTVILTGTPHGVGAARQPPCWLAPGDVVEVEIEGLGLLRNPVITAA
jgi:2-keto-4-pentenoate hydratase/2-oxohepta-3-ene-1,7-dioic acid hydratase in catechol pathway